jgi:hypothetical protein
LLQSDFAHKVLTGADGKLLVPAEELAAWAGAAAEPALWVRRDVVPAGGGRRLLLRGAVGRLMGRIRHRESGKETTFEVGAGAVVGEMSLMTGLPRMAEIQVTDSAELLRIPAPEFAELIGKHAGTGGADEPAGGGAGAAEPQAGRGPAGGRIAGDGAGDFARRHPEAVLAPAGRLKYR